MKFNLKPFLLWNYVNRPSLFRVPSRCIHEDRLGQLDDTNKKQEEPANKYKSFCTPPLKVGKVKTISSILGLNVGLTYISWALIETTGNKVTHMDHVMLPEGVNKMNLCDMYTMVVGIINLLPPANLYVMENVSKTVFGTGGRLQLTLQASRLQLMAMLVALLNHTRHDSDGEQCVIYLKPRLCGRLFSLLVGSELISSENTVSQLLTQNFYENIVSIKPEPQMVIKYCECSDVQKEIIGQALLVALTFVELVVHNNEKCYKKLFGRPVTTAGK